MFSKCPAFLVQVVIVLYPNSVLDDKYQRYKMIQYQLRIHLFIYLSIRLIHVFIPTFIRWHYVNHQWPIIQSQDLYCLNVVPIQIFVE
jgi:hypothetical protein